MSWANCAVLVLRAAFLALLLLIGSSTAAASTWICDGDPLDVALVRGAVDPSGLSEAIPNTLSRTLPGDGVLLTWRGTTLQLPRTNNAGTPSYSDGRWWWREENPDHPEFLERRGSIVSHRCDALP